MEKISELTHDISFATFRVASVVQHKYLRDELERVAALIAGKPDLENLASLERLITLAHSIGETSLVNKEVVVREINRLRRMMDDFIFEDIDAIDVNHIFNKEEEEPKKTVQAAKPVQAATKRQVASGNDLKRQMRNVQFEFDISGNLSPEDRQTAIAEYIREFPEGCKAKDLDDQFDVSRRTLRNDIKLLIEEGVIEREGGGGPHSYYIYVGDKDEPKSLEEANKELEIGSEEEVIYLSEPVSEYIN